MPRSPELAVPEVWGITAGENRSRYHRLVSFLPAGDRGLYARLTVRRQLEFWARIALVPRERFRETIDHAIETFDLAELAERRVDRMSMGQRQRLRIAMTVLAAITLGLGCTLFGLQLHWSTVPLSVPVMLLVLLAFLPFGMLFASLTVVVKQGNVGTSWVIALLSIVGGLYFPVSLLPQWLQTAAKLQPFTAATDVLRHLLVNSSLGGSPGTSLLKLAGFAAVLLPASIFVLASAIRLGQRRGTIIEY